MYFEGSTHPEDIKSVLATLEHISIFVKATIIRGRSRNLQTREGLCHCKVFLMLSGPVNFILKRSKIGQKIKIKGRGIPHPHPEISE